MRNLLLLGGSAQQVTAIETAKRLGCYTVLCDYLPDNPGQYAADKFYPVSTTDKEAVLKIARSERVDGILAYASDPAAPTAAYVAEKLGLPTNPYESVVTLCNKDKYRSFLAEHGFCTPKAGSYSDVLSACRALEESAYRFPVMVKPVDSSGSKGVSKLETPEESEKKLACAMSYSRSGRIIVEEFVEKSGYQVAGDGMSIDGKLVFRCFGNDHFDPACVGPFVPVSASFPCAMPESVHAKIHGEVQRLLSLLNMGTGTYNFDIRIDKDRNVYLMEVAPRSGGNYIPQLIRYATGVDMVECAVRAALGEPLDGWDRGMTDTGCWAYYAIHSSKSGILKEIAVDPAIQKNNIVEEHIIAKPGGQVLPFTGANTTLGILLMRFDSMQQMLHMMDNAYEWIDVILQ